MKIAYSSSELVDQYDRTSSGHFFDRDTMRFFKSKVTSNYKRLNDREALFITTEKGPNGVRKATIRRATLVSYIRESDKRECVKIEINTVGEFNELSLAKAVLLLNEV